MRFVVHAMAKFTFKLDPLLRARQLQERQRQRIVAEIERERLRFEQTLRGYQSGIAQGKQALRDQLIGTLDAHHLRMHAATSMHLMRKAQRLVLELAGVHKRLEAARAALVEAARQRRIVEILREKRLEQWLIDQNKAEAAVVDELAVIAAARSSSHTENQE